jgi:hypothetical protein
MRILVTGSRGYTNSVRIQAWIATLNPGTVIIQGGAKGADWLAAVAAKAQGLKVEVFKAQWNRFGSPAGMIRNKQMLEEGRPDQVVYFHDDIANSKGTWDMVSRARKAGISVIGNPGEE